MGVIGYKTTVKLGASDTIGKLIRASVSGATRDEIDVSNADSTDMVKELLGGMVTPGKATFTVRLSPTAAGLLETHFAAGTPEDCTITFEDTGTLIGEGFMSGLDPVELSYEGDVTQSFTFTYIELPDYTAPAG